MVENTAVAQLYFSTADGPILNPHYRLLLAAWRENHARRTEQPPASELETRTLDFTDRLVARAIARCEARGRGETVDVPNYAR